MRKKTEARRKAILAAAREVFQETGYEAASMSEIAVRVGGSKATLYNYFSSKEEILLAVMLDYGEEHAHDIFALLTESSDNLGADLVRFGIAYLKLITSEQALAFLRLAIAEGVRSNIGRRFYELGPKAVWSDRIATFFRAEIAKGILRAADPETMAMHLQGLYAVDMLRTLIVGTGQISDEEAAHKAVAVADVFMRAYGVDGRRP